MKVYALGKEIKNKVIKLFRYFWPVKPVLLGQNLNSLAIKKYLVETTPWYSDVLEKLDESSVDAWGKPIAIIHKIYEYASGNIYLIEISWPYFVDKGFYYMTLNSDDIRRFL